MASNVADSPFFQQQKAKGNIIVHDPPKFDLESYISNYDGFTRLDRLHHIGSHSAYLAVDAYRIAIAEAKQGKNVKLYLLLVEELSQIAPNDPAALTDTAWAEKKTREVQQEQDRLDHELKSYKNNLIKESIRMGNEDMGHFFYACGDWSAAHKAYMRMREHCTSNKHLADMTLRLVFVSIAQKSWLGVQSHVAKVDAAQLKGDEKIKLEPIISACTGLAHMCTSNFRDAATNFIHTFPTFLTLEPAAGITWQREVLSGNDIAVYGGLCALASMDRSELQNQVLANSDFRNFLELEPHIRRAITLFCNSKYSACLEILEGYRNDYLLDVYLSKVLSTIYGRIRTKSIVQYFIPFSCVTLDEMATKFQLTGEFATIEDELETMINNGTLDARIDLVDRLLISPPTNPRYNVHADALAMAEKYDHTLRLRLTRLNMLAAGMEIRPDKNQPREGPPGTGEGLSSGMRGIGSRLGLT
ncbi:PCI-domain-containing protein [Trematosphaeria pertusa]|uniref:COP9 signalosome complex subunit 1 n=1 Tax=Trematosphaeria pertusa TaxID=390896 RepID=A0A6A6IX36_9PLEO|nr:PCI-domain-containing protein [Trematosphaeria pertusa]KAF2254954.1 PCI-domain-containing protein [Trematosphaeria pertusa]